MGIPKWTTMHKVLPPGERGAFKLEHFEIGAPSARMMMMHPEEYIPPGKYVRLLRMGKSYGQTCVMSDTPHEHRTNVDVLHRAQGDVLVAGLGLGMILLPLLAKPEVTRVLVLEKEQDLLYLVLPRLKEALTQAQREKLYVLHADAFKFEPAPCAKFDTIYFDIWDNICADNWKQIGELKRKYAKLKRKGGWMGAWAEPQVRRLVREANAFEERMAPFKEMHKARRAAALLGAP